MNEETTHEELPKPQTPPDPEPTAEPLTPTYEDVEESRAKVVESEGVDAGTGQQGTGQSVEVDQVAPTGNEE